MTKHLACKLEQSFFSKVQKTIPITKHILILNGMQITLKCCKFIPWTNTKQFAWMQVIKKIEHIF
jgi:hypothetical protein